MIYFSVSNGKFAKLNTLLFTTHFAGIAKINIREIKLLTFRDIKSARKLLRKKVKDKRCPEELNLWKLI